MIPLRAIISGSGGPKMNTFFNLYYVHWWSLTHFLFHYENGIYRQGVAALIRNGDSGVEAFEKQIGNVEQIESEWYAYCRDLKRQLFGLTPRERAGTKKKTQ